MPPDAHPRPVCAKNTSGKAEAKAGSRRLTLVAAAPYDFSGRPYLGGGTMQSRKLAALLAFTLVFGWGIQNGRAEDAPKDNKG